MFKKLMVCAAMMTAMTFGGCTDDTVAPTKGGTFYSATATMGHGTVRSYVTLAEDGKPTDFGIVMSETSMSGLPSTGGHEHNGSVTLTLPSQASMIPVNHISIDWNPAGHEPPGIYDLPHFDFHFYMISEAERNQITAVGADTLKVGKMPEPQFRPQGYASIPGGVPRMGAHWFDPTSPEFNGSTFTKTYLYGFYDGKMIFFEPMITKAYIESKPNATQAVKLPQAFPKSGYYPTNYTVGYNASTKEYRISFGALTQQL